MFNRKFHYKWSIFHSYVKLPEGKYEIPSFLGPRMIRSNTSHVSWAICLIYYGAKITDSRNVIGSEPCLTNGFLTSWPLTVSLQELATTEMSCNLSIIQLSGKTHVYIYINIIYYISIYIVYDIYTLYIYIYPIEISAFSWISQPALFEDPGEWLVTIIHQTYPKIKLSCDMLR